MDFSIDINSAVTTLTVFVVLGLARTVITLRSDVEVLKSHHVGTEQMRRIISDMQAPLVTEVHHLGDKIDEMQAQIAGRRSTD